MATLSGQKTVAAAGTAEALSASNKVQCALAIKGLTANTGLVYIGNDGSGAVSSSTGFPLAAGDTIILEYVDDLASIWVDSAVNGEGVAWIALHE
jgi:hypothetical protein